jgi:hypothetical protein
MLTTFFLSLFFSVLPAISSAGGIDYCKSLKGELVKPIGAVEKIWKSELELLAMSPPMAKRADDLLSVLIEKKSPVLDQWMEKRSLYWKDEELIVRAWRTHFTESQLLNHPNRDDVIRKIVESFAAKVGKKTFPAKERQKFERLFREAKKESLKILAKQANTNSISKRVEGIQLFWLEDLPKAKTPKSPLEFLDWGIAYDPVPNVINIGIRALEYPNEATIFAVFVHEIAHAFDPCRTLAFLPDLQAGGPFASIHACLREKEAAGALARDDSQLDAIARAKGLGADFPAMMRLNPTCTKQDYPPEGVQADQIPETFADWFSAEVVADSRYAIRGLRSDLCVEKELRKGSSYLTNANRLERIYLANPRLRKNLKLSAATNVKYCELKPASANPPK